MDAKPMINCPTCGGERPDLILPWCPRPDCPSTPRTPEFNKAFDEVFNDKEKTDENGK